jgi:hypothetical protein
MEDMGENTGDNNGYKVKSFDRKLAGWMKER